MKVAISLSEEARTEYDPNARGHGAGYMDSRCLADAFVKRGHDLGVVHPSDIFCKQGKLYARKIYAFNKGVFSISQRDTMLSGDVFFVYSLNEERGLDSSIRFIDFLYPMATQFNLVLNSAESTSYEYKPKQKKLNLPWIPDFDVQTAKDLSDLVASGEKIIAKPKIGACSQGIVFLEDVRDIKKIEDVHQFIFERYVPNQEERRYVFLDNQCIIQRKIKKEGAPGEERCTNVDLMEGPKKELELARQIVSSLGMFYAAVDFRGEYLLEINGSGTGVSPITAEGEMDAYNISSPIVQAVERKLKKQ